MSINLERTVKYLAFTSSLFGEVTLLMRARKNDRTRYLKRSSSVWMTIKPKLEPASIRAVASSICSIFLSQGNHVNLDATVRAMSEERRHAFTCARILFIVLSISFDG